ncbi:hypothetical protein AB0N93_22145 [Streptomyces sp. NPDC091267]|uniref:hypothetical protein n=1 Tax=Streptomyces sp. NPDC091267 TaxID=3155195 RepID=UPI00342BCA35
MFKTLQRRLTQVGAVVGTGLLAVALANPAQAATGVTPDPAPAKATTAAVPYEAVGVDTARALSLAEIKSRGLTEYVDLDSYRSTKPVRSNGGGAAPTARNGFAAAPEAASGCWSHDFRSSGTDQLYGTGHADWCGNGTAITYATSTCSGDEASWIPTYKYLSCAVTPGFGVGFNVYDVAAKWDLCALFVPIWGNCTSHGRPTSHYRYGPNGEVWLMSQTPA